MINKILDSFGIKESWRTWTLVVWSLSLIRIIFFIYETDSVPNEHIFDWIKFFSVILLYIVLYTLFFLVLVFVTSKIVKPFERTPVFRFISRIFDAINAFFLMLFMPENSRKGTEAEVFVDEELFPDTHYEIMHRTVDYHTNKWRRVRDSLLPDFRFRDRKTDNEFWVEVKYRSKWKGDEPEQYIDFLDEEYKLERYKKVDKELPVFVALCTGHTSLDPAESFLIPVRFIKMSDRIYRKYLLPFQTHTQDQTLDELDISVSSESLWKRLNQ